MAATCGGIRVHSVYTPNGREPDSDHYVYKLAWLAALRDVVAAGPAAAVVCGDMNIAPTDADVFDPAAYVGQTHVTPPERAALAALQAASACATWSAITGRRERVFSYWDYRAGMFQKDLGMRIDLVLASEPVAEPASARPGSTARRARARCRATTHRSSSTSTRRPTATSGRSCRRRRRRPQAGLVQAAPVVAEASAPACLGHS